MNREYDLAPIVLFVYNRPEHTHKTVEALKKNDLALDSDLFIFSDGAKNEVDKAAVLDIRKYIKAIDGFKSVNIFERDKNYGLAKSIIYGVTKIVNEYGKVIVLEDDLITSPFFLSFMNDSLSLYEKEKQVGMIHGHIYNIKDMPDLFFIYKAGCLGWGTWADRWITISFDGQMLLSEINTKKLNFKFDVNKSYPYTQMLQDQIDGKNNSWAIRLYASFLLNNLLTFYPGKSLVQHIGFDIGTHCKGEREANDMDGFITDKLIVSKKINIENSNEAIKKIEFFYKAQKKSFLKKILNKFKSVFMI